MTTTTTEILKNAATRAIVDMDQETRALLTQGDVKDVLRDMVLAQGLSYSDYHLLLPGLAKQAIHNARFQVALQLQRENRPYPTDLKVCGQPLSYKMYDAAGYKVAEERRAAQAARDAEDRALAEVLARNFPTRDFYKEPHVAPDGHVISAKLVHTLRRERQATLHTRPVARRTGKTEKTKERRRVAEAAAELERKQRAAEKAAQKAAKPSKEDRKRQKRAA